MKKNPAKTSRSHRRASIMIMVVALLVLMALIGTAYIVSVRIDRGSTRQNQSNVQIDLLIEGVLNMCKSAVAGDVYGYDTTTPKPLLQFRPSEPLGGWPNPAGGIPASLLVDTYRYHDITSSLYSSSTAKPPNTRFDWWLADRVPYHNDSGTAAPGDDHYFWPHISQSLLTEMETAGLVRGYFEDPTYYPNNANNPPILRFRHDGEPLAVPPADTIGLEPTFKILDSGVMVPAFAINTTLAGHFAPGTTLSGLPNPYYALAADTDGDGIADAFLFRLPVGVIDGVTYYAAARIVDNCAAINLNTAWADQAPVGPPGNLTSIMSSGDRLFPNSVNIIDLIAGPNTNAINTEFDRIRQFRLQSPGPSYNAANSVPVDLTKPILDTDTNNPKIPRNDFVFVNEHDAQWMLLGRRIENPGIIPNSANMQQRYRAFPLSDMVALSSRFVLNTNYGLTSSEDVLQRTLAGPYVNPTTIRNKPYAPDDINKPGNDYSWGPQNFWSRPPINNRDYSRRAIAVTSNAVASITTGKFMPSGSVDINDDTNKANDVATRDMLDAFPDILGSWPRPGGTRYVKGKIVTNRGLSYVYAGHNTSTTPKEPGTLDGQQDWELQTYSRIPVKTSLNTATFRELYRSYWQVMSGDFGNQTPHGTATATNNNPYVHNNNPQRQFRSSLRDVRTPFGGTTYRFDPFNQMLLRAALAAVNTIDLRDNDYDITSRQIILEITDDDGNKRPVEVTVYGSERQPFITEVYANTDNATGDTLGVVGTDDDTNPKGYVAVELFNPYDTRISLVGWKLAVVDRRRPAAATPNAGKHEAKIIYEFKANNADTEQQNFYIDPGKHLFLHNYTPRIPPPQDAARKPRIQFGPNWRYIPTLHKVFEDQSTNESGGELVLLRPRREDAKLTASNRAADNYSEFDPNNPTNSQPWELVPVDQFDFTGMKIRSRPADINAPRIDVAYVHYIRLNNDTDNRWRCVYPGPYNAGKSPDVNRHQSNDYREWKAPVLGTETRPSPRNMALDGNDFTPTYTSNFPPIQINNRDFPGPEAIVKSTPRPNRFPFGGFMRVGDIMQVPYIGAYRLRELQSTGSNQFPSYAPRYNAATTDAKFFLELNSLPMDSSFADDTDANDNLFENIGRFCPILPIFSSTSYPHYDFAKRIFDFFTVISPQDDQFPEMNPDRTLDPNKNSTTAYRYQDGTNLSHEVILPNPPPSATDGIGNAFTERVKNVDNGSSTFPPEESVGVHGLININTASARVLGAVPWTSDPVRNMEIGKAIADYRDFGDPTVTPPVPAPYRSIFDLYKVKGKIAGNPSWLTFVDMQPPSDPNNPNDPNDADGDFSPEGTAVDGVTGANEFEQRFLLTNRVSNLLTVRSDSFIAYVVVQGWRNANTPQAELVVQRRAGLLIDRSGVNATNKEVKTMLIPIE